MIVKSKSADKGVISKCDNAHKCSVTGMSDVLVLQLPRSTYYYDTKTEKTTMTDNIYCGYTQYLWIKKSKRNLKCWLAVMILKLIMYWTENMNITKNLRCC